MAQFEFQGKTVYYEVLGEGEPILLLNGIMMTSQSWGPFIENFTRFNQLILLDFFDQGQSAKMSGPYDQSVQVALVGALLDTLKLEKINICGTSYGAEVGLGFAVQFPQKVRRLVLFNGAARTAPQIYDIGLAWNEAAKLEGGLAYYLAAIPIIYSDSFYEKEKAKMDKRKETLVSVFANAEVKEQLIRLTNSSGNFNVIDKLPALDIPILVVSADKDYLTPRSEQEIIVRLVKNAYHIVLSDCGHASVYEKPLLFCSLTLGFINSSNTSFII
jgi:pimeloyl-ACP methyl ester carboxylesterase